MRALLIALVLLFAACEEPVLFTRPQPVETASLDHFPKRWQGEYMLLEDSSRLVIGHRTMIAMNEWEIRRSVRDVDSTTFLIGDTLLAFGQGRSVPVFVRSDSVFGMIRLIDTLFTISDQQILKRMSGSLIINRAHGAAGWEVSRMTLSNGKLRIAEIKDPGSMSVLNEVLVLPGDTISTALELSRRQFRGVVSNGGFVLDKEYMRLRRR